MTRGKTCCECKHFTTRAKPADPTQIPEAIHGIGICTGYDGHVPAVQRYVAWNAPFCVLFWLVNPSPARAEWIQIQKDREANLTTNHEDIAE